MNRAVADWCRTFETDELVDRLLALDIPAGPVRSPYDAPNDPHVRHRGSLERLPHPDRGETDFLGPALPVRLSRGDRGTAPAEPLGASSEAVLGELLGLPGVEIARLRNAGALG